MMKEEKNFNFNLLLKRSEETRKDKITAFA